MNWSIADASFEEGLLEAIQYAQENGDLDVPSFYISPTGYKLGTWINRMRMRYHRYNNNAPLEPDQIKRLEEIGMSWQNRYDKKWNQYYTEAKEYYNAHGDLSVPDGYIVKGMRLGRWIRRQRVDARNGKISADKLEQLKKIGFSIETRNKTWDYYFSLAKRYFICHGDLDIPPAYVEENGVWLGKWIAIQRLERQNGKLTKEKIEKLDSIGMRWVDIWTKQWLDYLEEVRSFPRDPAGVPVIPTDALSRNGTNLKVWMERQQRKYRQGKMDTEKKRHWEKMLQEKQNDKKSH